MNEDFVIYELAKKLKEKGFRRPCVATYDKDGMLGYNYYQPKSIKAVSFDDCLCISDDLVLAPTISQVLKWLREEKKIYLELVIVVDAEYMCDIYKIDARPIECLGSTEYYKTYEQAALAGIECVLNNLI